VSAKMFLHFLFPSATNSCCAHHWWECCCAHRLTHKNFLGLTCNKDWVLVKAAVGNAVCRFIGASVFWSCNLMATSCHSLEFWNDQSLEVLGTRTEDDMYYSLNQLHLVHNPCLVNKLSLPIKLACPFVL
jgi:5-keto 4-deoxyuronate isomerase